MSAQPENLWRLYPMAPSHLPQVLEIERTLVPNGSLTTWARQDGELRLVSSNSTGHLDGAGLPA